MIPDTPFVREFLDHTAWHRSALNLQYTASELWTAMQRLDGDRHYEDPGGSHADIAGPSAAGGWKPYNHEPAILLLAGYAIENMAKAVIVKKGKPEEILREKKSVIEAQAWFGRHSLATFCQRTGITLTDDERGFTNRLEQFVVWAGRYPARLNDVRDLGVTVVHATDMDMLNHLMRSLDSKYSDAR